MSHSIQSPQHLRPSLPMTESQTSLRFDGFSCSEGQHSGVLQSALQSGLRILRGKAWEACRSQRPRHRHRLSSWLHKRSWLWNFLGLNCYHFPPLLMLHCSLSPTVTVGKKVMDRQDLAKQWEVLPSAWKILFLYCCLLVHLLIWVIINPGICISYSDVLLKVPSLGHLACGHTLHAPRCVMALVCLHCFSRLHASLGLRFTTVLYRTSHTHKELWFLWLEHVRPEFLLLVGHIIFRHSWLTFQGETRTSLMCVRINEHLER